MVAIKNWFLDKEMIKGYWGKEITIEKETEKAVLVSVWFDEPLGLPRKSQHWIPKSCLCDEWEKDTSNFAYHDYLVDVYHKAYDEKKIENYTIKSGRNRYRGDNFVHQLSTKDLQASLKKHGIEFKDKDTWKNS